MNHPPGPEPCPALYADCTGADWGRRRGCSGGLAGEGRATGRCLTTHQGDHPSTRAGAGLRRLQRSVAGSTHILSETGDGTNYAPHGADTRLRRAKAGSCTDAKRRRASMGASVRRGSHTHPAGSAHTRSCGKRPRRVRGDSCAEEIRLWHSPEALTERRKRRTAAENIHTGRRTSDGID